MTTISGLGTAPSIAQGNNRTASGGGAAFEVPNDTRPPAVATARPSAAVGGMLMLQEQEVDRLKEREARRRGQDALAALRAMQAALLAGHVDPAVLHQLRALCAGPLPDCDPGLRHVVAAILLRSRIEAARHERPH